MTDVVFVHAPEPEHPGGGADVRARALAREVGKHLSTELLTIGPTGDVDAHSRSRDRVSSALRGIPPRWSQRYDPRAQAEIRKRISRARIVVAETLFTFPYLLGASPRVVL